MDKKIPTYKNSRDKSYYFTTAINYTNGAPHMGHAYEIVTSDILVRIAKLFGFDVRFQTGTDEHGQKIATTAEKNGFSPKELCDKNVKQFESMNESLQINADRFIRTTDIDHYESCKELWKRCEAKGDIYLGKYDGWYNIREESFMTELEAKMLNYTDPVSGLPLTKMEEPSYFFRISKYIESVKNHIINHPDFIQPESSRESILARLDALGDNLEDLSISRTSFSWGVPVPNDQEHVMYVWFDALTNYITGLNWHNSDSCDENSLFKKYWGNTIHIVGKDITWFHTVIWPSMLLSVGLSLPKTIFSHGFVTAPDGKKMSKSLGNVVDPLEQIDKMGSDSFRYYLAREGRYGNDIKYQPSSVVDYNNGELADTFGNLISRITNLAHKFCQGVAPSSSTSVFLEKPIDIETVFEEYYLAWRGFRLDECAQIAMNLSRNINKFLTDHAPWNKDNEKSEEERIEIIRIVLEGSYYISILLSPFTTLACKEVFNRLGTQQKTIPEIDTNYSNIKPNTPILIGEPLFRRIATKADKTFEELKAEKKEREKNKRTEKEKKRN
ncbi:methionine-tRNA ligase [Cryptosporidium ubiquitum]|uniref:methionine--tRNA ligase n=1 Tax=Cryptosporidium ubiquitum TaxID=857276 RepID=A0A1J4MHN4_9CRYT|nr:methionine-tRNA ligase [Cryptosporidium ubiquitum]OII73778.1 methionine-tRNA ligase [Cryptosporidium ubiquitum]